MAEKQNSWGDLVESFHMEYVADRMGNLRQAGTVDPQQTSVQALRTICEKSLYAFCLFVLGRQYLTTSLHRPVCNWLTRTPPYRKLLLLPRRHAKTSIVSHGLPLHLIIQPINGLYVPWKQGSELRIMMAGETETRACDNMRVIRNVLESSEMFRGLWPHLVWDNPRREADKWNEKALIVRREENYPDPTFRAIGVGGAITGARHDVHIKDDLVSEEAANSEVVMDSTIRWHINSRALFDDPDKSLEYVIGTRWAVQDLYSYIVENDPTVSYIVRSILENGKPIYPEAFSMETISRLKQEFGIMFPLMYMNNIGDPDLVDFTLEDLRFFKMADNLLLVENDSRDAALEAIFDAIEAPMFEIEAGTRMSADVQSVFGHVRDNYFRFKGN